MSRSVRGERSRWRSPRRFLLARIICEFVLYHTFTRPGEPAPKPATSAMSEGLRARDNGRHNVLYFDAPPSLRKSTSRRGQRRTAAPIGCRHAGNRKSGGPGRTAKQLQPAYASRTQDCYELGSAPKPNMRIVPLFATRRRQLWDRQAPSSRSPWSSKAT